MSLTASYASAGIYSESAFSSSLVAYTEYCLYRRIFVVTPVINVPSARHASSILLMVNCLNFCFEPPATIDTSHIKNKPVFTGPTKLTLHNPNLPCKRQAVKGIIKLYQTLQDYINVDHLHLAVVGSLQELEHL